MSKEWEGESATRGGVLIWMSARMREARARGEILRGVGSAVVCLSLSACAPVSVGPEISYAHNASDGKLALEWNCLYQRPGLVIRGLANSPWLSQPIKDLHFWVYGIDSQGRNVSNSSGSASRYVINTGQLTPFELPVVTTGTEVRFDLTYAYRVSDALRLDSPGEQINTTVDACPGVRP